MHCSSEPLPFHVAGFFHQGAGWKGGHAFCPPVVMLPQVPLSSVQPAASAKPIPWVPLASQASYGVTLSPQSLIALSASNERDSFLVVKQVCAHACSRVAFQLERLFTGLTVPPLVSCRSGNSQNSKQSQKHLRRSPRSQRCLQSFAGGMAARKKQGPAARPSQDSRMALLLRSAEPCRNCMDALGSTMAAVVGALEMECERTSATESAHCSSYAAGTAVFPSCLASVSRAAEQAFDCLLIYIENSYSQLPAQVTILC